jgi:hypothetical protein
MDRLRAQLARFEDAFPGFSYGDRRRQRRREPGEAVRRGDRPALVGDRRTAAAVRVGRRQQRLVPFGDAHEFCPDLAVIPAEAAAENRSAYPADLIELVAEVVSPESVRNDYEVKNKQYASRGIPNYLIFDRQKGHVVTLWNPGSDGYRGRDTLPYGGKVTVETRIGHLTVDTSRLPVELESPGAC